MFRSLKIIIARRIMRKALKSSETRDIHRERIATCIYLNRRPDGRLNRFNCNAVAEKLIKLLY